MSNRMHLIFLTGITAFAFLLRIYFLDQHLFFGFEQGRDAAIVRSIATFKDVVLVGPKTDIGGIFHGAWYFYLLVAPFWLGQGNPFVLSYTLVFLGCLLVPLLYHFAFRITGSKWAALFTACATALSFDAIQFSRWLSNVSPAYLFVPASWFFLWNFYSTKRGYWLVLATVSAVFAIQFEIVLALFYIFALCILLLLRFIPKPSLKALVMSVGTMIILFLPMIIFNFRNQNIILNSVGQYIQGTSDHERQSDYVHGIKQFTSAQKRMFHESLFLSKEPVAITIFAGTFLLGLCIAFSQPKLRNVMVFCTVWAVMGIPSIFFSEIAGASQLYVGQAPAYILLAAISFVALLSHEKVKVFALIPIVAIFIQFGFVEEPLRKNHMMFFKTIQDDLNYKDQVALLSWMHADAGGKPYRFDAYTIPYFQPHGWNYLREYLFPSDTSNGAERIYIVVEEKVDSFWEKKWIDEIGETQLIEEQKFGKIRIQERELL